MFQSLRQQNIFYILQKGDNPGLKVGQVVSVSNPQPKYGQLVPGQAFGQNVETVVDVSVKVGEETMEFKQLPANLSIANFGSSGVVVSESREAMLRTSEQVLESIPYHENVIASCDDMLKVLNPQLAKEKAQEEKIGALEQKVSGMEGTLTDIREMLSKALNGSGNSKKTS